MSLKNYNKKQSIENNNQIAIDFDGVIHKNTKGYFDGTIYDEPVQGSYNALKELASKFTFGDKCSESPGLHLVGAKKT